MDTTGGAGPEPRWGSGRVVALAAAGLLLLHAILAWQLRAPGLTTGQDDAIYLLLGRALRQLSYQDLWLVGTPGESRYPPAYPAVLALLGIVLGDGTGAAVFLNVLCSTLALLVLFLLVRRVGAGLALVVLLLAALNPALLDQAGEIRSEPLFMLLTLTAFWCLARPAPSTGWLLLAAACALLAALTRSIGVVLLPALLLVWLAQRRYRAMAAVLVAGLVTVGGWFLWTARAPVQLAGESYLADALLPAAEAESPSAPVAAKPRDAGPPLAATLGQLLLARARVNGPLYATRSVPSVLTVPTIGGTTADNWFWVAVLAVGGGIGLVALLRWQPVAGLYLLGYAALLLAWPYALSRFLVPLVPLLLLIVFLGVRRVAGTASVRAGRAAVGVLALLLLVPALAAVAERHRALAGCDRRAPYRSAACYPERERAFFQVALAADSLLPPGAVLLTPKAATVHYLTGRRTVRELEAASQDPAGLMAFLRRHRVRHILLSRVHQDQRVVAQLLRPVCGRLEVRAAAGIDALLLELTDEAEARACGTLDAFAATGWRGAR